MVFHQTFPRIDGAQMVALVGGGVEAGGTAGGGCTATRSLHGAGVGCVVTAGVAEATMVLDFHKLYNSMTKLMK